MRFRIFLLAWAALAAGAQTRIVLRTGALLDGKGGVFHDRQIVIEGSRIVSVGAPTEKPTYDLARLTIMPGWIDTHVHINWHMDANRKSVNSREAPELEALYTAGDAWITLQGGFTTVQSPGAAMDGVVRDRINQGVIPGPRLLSSLRQINADSGQPRGDLTSLRALVRKTKEEGADVIKLFATSGLGAGGGQTMTAEQIQAVCQEAKAVGLRSVVHAIGDAGARAAVEAGCTSIEHGTFLSDATLDLMARLGAYFDPNLLVLHNYLDNRASFSFNERQLDILEKGIAPTEDVLRRARARKLKIVFGTDAVAGSHGRNAEEFIYRVQDAGEKPMDALISATSVSAEALGLGNEIGTLAAGFQADLVATEGNPLDDITAVRRVAFVMKGGRMYKGP